MMGGPLSILTQLASWLFLPIDLVGVVVAAVFLRLSRAMPLVLLGFAGSFLAGLMSRGASTLATAGSVDYARLAPVFALSTLLGLAANALIVLGIALVFADLRRQLGDWKHRVEDL